MKTTMTITITLADTLEHEEAEAERDFARFVAATHEPHEHAAILGDYAHGMLDLTDEQRAQVRAVRAERPRDRRPVLRDLASGALELG